MASQMSWGAKSGALSCGSPPPCSVASAAAAASTTRLANITISGRSGVDRDVRKWVTPRDRLVRSAEQNDKGDKQAEKAGRLGKGEADEQVRELPRGCR